jgi:hypothetical protein
MAPRRGHDMGLEDGSNYFFFASLAASFAASAFR